jgi:hypothetical protein
MPSKTEICNLAISHTGSGKAIDDFDTDSSEEAVVCRRHYATVRDMVLRDFQWPFARKNVALALVEENPTSEWYYSYQLPADSLLFVKILSGIRNDHSDSVIPYIFAHGTSGTVIYTDRQEAEAMYIARIDDVQRYTPDFINAFALRLAMTILPRLSGGDPNKMMPSIAQLYEFEIEKARGAAGNEQQPDPLPETPSIRARQ